MKDELKIVMLEDTASDAGLIERCLKINNFNYTSKVVFSREGFMEALKEFSPDLILSDHQLPQFDSFDALKILKEKNLRIPFILVTGTVSEEFAAIIIKEGADDYILKRNLSRLPNAIKAAIEKRENETEKEKYQKELENKIQEINNFIYRISHDLRAPLASTFGLLALARKNIKDKNAPEYLDRIEHSNKKMENILLSFAEIVRISQEKTTEEIINLKKLTEEIIENLKNIPESEGIKFELFINSELEFFGNRDILNSIFQNLIHNAIKYCRPVADSFIKIKISEKANEIIIEISDNGIGIQKELQSGIFEMFFRATISSTGSGLGLYIVKNAVEKLFGKISFTSVPGEGTAFKIVLPKSNTAHRL